MAKSLRHILLTVYSVYHSVHDNCQLIMAKMDTLGNPIIKN